MEVNVLELSVVEGRSHNRKTIFICLHRHDSMIINMEIFILILRHYFKSQI